jgi:hypothetical protein
LTPSDIGAAPAASPTFTGNATFNGAIDAKSVIFCGVAAGADQWNIYADGTAQNWFAGNVGIGVSRSTPASALDVNGVITVAAGSAAAPAIVASGDSNTGLLFPAADTVAISTAGVERVRVRSDGNVGLGGTGASNVGVYHQHTLSSASTRYGELVMPTVSADSTSNVLVVASAATMAADATTGTLALFHTNGATLGSGASITNQYGFFVGSGFTAATNNYGVYSGIASATGRWNFYADGTAQNYFAGNVGIGASRTTPATALDVNGVITVSAGSAAAPALCFSGDSNTGIAQVGGSDTLSAVVAGSERLRVGFDSIDVYQAPAGTSMSRVRLNSSAGASQFAVLSYGASYASATVLSVGAGGTALAAVSGTLGIATLSASPLTLGTNSVERVRIKSTGAVRFVPLAADPASGNEAGDVYYNSSTNKLRVYDGTNWVDLH